MIHIGINGFGRIGKCVFLQLLENENFSIKCLNALNITVNEIEDYLCYDTTHGRNEINVEVIDDNTFKINKHIIKLVSDRDAKKIDWKKNGCEYLIDATGSYLTTEKCKEHNADYIIMTSPSKDNTKTIIYGVNETLYEGEKVISGSSCTTNCISPLLKILNDTYGIRECVFTTIHATTASQYVVDVLQKSSRTNRSILNNIIPHTTGASSSVTAVLPELEGKINGTSVRVPVVNCSLVDINVSLQDTNITIKDISTLLKSHQNYKTVYDVSNKKLVSCDFTTTKTPTILDVNSSIDMGNGKHKLMVWYDNEWSYSAQIIRLVQHMYEHNHNMIKQKYSIDNLYMKNKGVVCRLDLNVPVNEFKEITDEFRIYSAIPTIQRIMSKKPKYIVLTSHFGRPKGHDMNFSLQFLVDVLEKYLNTKVQFLEKGLSNETLKEIQENPQGIYLLENIRFHEDETSFEKGLKSDTLLNIYKELGDIFICDAFGCAHRKHLSIYAMSSFGKPYGYGLLIKKEVEAINKLINSDQKVLGIIGGNKISDKITIIDTLKKIPNSTIFVAGGLAKNYTVLSKNEFVMNDGYGGETLSSTPRHINNIYMTDLNVYDIGFKSLTVLLDLVDKSDVIFWNGSLGVIEDTKYRIGSQNLIDYLTIQKNKTIIIGGGETASLVKNKNGSIYISTGGGALLEYLQNKILNNSTLVGLNIFI
jgi:glyceraldehyde 3-phosphate dehydrogenase